VKRKMNEMPIPAEFMELLREYNACVPEFSAEGVRLRVHVNEDETLEWNLRVRPEIFGVLPYTEHSVKLLRGLCKVATHEDWSDVHGPLFCDLRLGAVAPTVVIADYFKVAGVVDSSGAPVPPRTFGVGELPPVDVRVPVWVWLLLRLYDPPGMNQYPVLGESNFTLLGTALSPWHQQNVRECLALLRRQGVLGSVSRP
jgi:hypothetical protein